MSRLDTAMARFSAALERLETSVDERMAQAREAMNSMAELAILKAEQIGRAHV